MKLRSLTLIGLLGAALFLNSCGKDDAAPKQQLVAGNKTISLKGDNLYLSAQDYTYNAGAREGARGIVYPSFKVRTFFISDGELSSGDDGWDLGSYTNATYYLAIQIAVPIASTLEVGEYMLVDPWSSANGLNNIGAIWAEGGEGNDYVEIWNNEETVTPIVVSGGIDGDDKLTLKFSGKLSYYRYNDEEEMWESSTENGKLLFTGTIHDIRVPI